MRYRQKSGLPRDMRRQMIAETSAYLSWALRNGAEAPRIPTRRVSQGGFTGIMRQRGMRAVVMAFWDRTLARAAKH